MDTQKHRTMNLEKTDWKTETLDLLDFPIDVRINETTGQIQFIFNEKLRKAIGPDAIEEVMMRNEVLDLCIEINKLQSLFPIYNEK